MTLSIAPGTTATTLAVSNTNPTAGSKVTDAAAGTHTISARYRGDPNFTTSTSAVAAR